MKEVYVTILQDGSTTSVENMTDSLEQALKDTWDLIYERADFTEKPTPQELLWENNGDTEERCITTGSDPEDYTYFILRYTY